MNGRRKFLVASLALSAPLGVLAQTVHRIGFLGFSSAGFAGRFEALKAGLRELGYVEGKNLIIEQRWADGRYERMPALAAELVRLKVDVIVTHGSPGSLAAKQATSTIPIVMAQGGDAVATGLVSSLARPGGNITGLTQLSGDMYVKRLELLREISSRAVRIGMIVNPVNLIYRKLSGQLEAAAKSMKVALRQYEARQPADFEPVFAAMAGDRVEAVIVGDDGTFTSNARLLADLATRRRLPSIGSLEYVQAGGLMAYSANFADMFRRAAGYVDHILKGAKPADLPIQQPTKFETVVNLRAARAIGVKIPQAVQLRADRLIE